jgi:hypothetical protein
MAPIVQSTNMYQIRNVTSASDIEHNVTLNSPRRALGADADAVSHLYKERKGGPAGLRFLRTTAARRFQSPALSQRTREGQGTRKTTKMSFLPKSCQAPWSVDFLSSC